MTYTRLNYELVPDSDCRHAFERVNMYLHDVYGMFRHLPTSGDDGDGGNFSIALVLTCVIDGLSGLRWPLVRKHKKRFIGLICDDLWWSPRWMDREEAAEQIYYEFRNMLVHELAVDRATDWRPAGYDEPTAGRWGEIPADKQSIATIDALEDWSDAWPILYEVQNAQRAPRYKLAVASLYWAVKHLAKTMIVNACRSPV